MLNNFKFMAKVLVTAAAISACDAVDGGSSQVEGAAHDLFPKMMTSGYDESEMPSVLDWDSFNHNVTSVGEWKSFPPPDQQVGIRLKSRRAVPVTMSVEIVKPTTLNCVSNRVLNRAESYVCGTAKRAHNGSGNLQAGTSFDLELEYQELELESGGLMRRLDVLGQLAEEHASGS